MIQLQMLNRILQSKNTSLITINNLTDEYFSEYKAEFDFIKNHLDTYGNIPDMESFLGRFQDFDVIQVNETDNYLIDALYEDRNQRELASIFNKVRKLIMDNKTDEAMRLYLNASQNVVRGVHLDSVDILRDTSRFDRYVEKCNDFNKYYVSTGFTELDEIIGGWDRNEELATIAARSGIGKSWLLLFVAVAAAKQGLNVGIYSGEMSEDKVGYRVDTLISHLSNGQIIHGNANVSGAYKEYIEKLPTTLKGSIRVLTPAKINGPAGVTALRAFIEKDNLDMLCVDQHSLLEDDRNAKNPVERAANISRDLKNLQVMKRIPIISVSQQNRSSVENGVSTANIAQSDRIAQDSTIILFLEQKDGILTIHLTKSRDSVNAKDLKYAIDLDKGIFTYIPESGDVSKEQAQSLADSYEAEDCGGDVF